MPGATSRMGELCMLSDQSCHIYGAWRNNIVSGEILKSSYGIEATKGWDHFLLGELTLKTPGKDFDLAIRGGLGWMKWLKNGTEKGFIFH